MPAWRWLGRLFGAERRAAALAARGQAAAAFVESRLHQLSDPAKPSASDGTMEERILGALLAKGFRKYAVSAKQRAGIAEAVRRAVAVGAPIPLWFSFGGYKLWRFDEAPEADWAELFTLIHYASWLKPVAAIYPPGVVFDFASDAIVVERLNNIPKAETDAYAASFARVIARVAPLLPKNLAFRFFSVYEPAEFEPEFTGHLAAIRAQNGGRPAALGQWSAPSIELNVRPRAGQTDDPLWREKVYELLLAYNAMAKRSERLSGPDRIIVAPTRIEHRNCIPVGSTRASVAKFWTGVGALRPAADSFIEAVLSPSQLRKAAFDWVPVAVSGLEGRNFARLRILREEAR